jgi:E3 ubiquitin-protein ligase RHA2
MEDTIDLNVSFSEFMDAVRLVVYINLCMNVKESKSTNKIVTNSNYKLCKEKSIYCVVCLQHVKSNEYYRELNCKHSFHKKCIDKWMKKCIDYNHTASCPICRSNAEKLS